MTTGLKVLLRLAAVCLNATAADINVPSASRSDVVSAIASASTNDRLLVPAGHESWASEVLLDKVVHIIAAGTNSTKIINTSGGENTFLFRVDTGSENGSVRISGFGMYGTNNGAGNYQGSGVFVEDGQKNVRIDHCDFTNMRRHGVQFVGWPAWGVVDHCAFTNCYTGVEANGNDTESWNDTYEVATTNSVVLEDVRFVNNTSSGVTDLNNMVYNSNGGRMIIRRFEVIGNDTGNSLYFLDTHGNNTPDAPTGNPNDLRGGLYTLVYDGTIAMDRATRHCYQRGGLNLFANITVTDPGGSSVIVLTDEDGWHWDYEPWDTTWPSSDGITNSWIANVLYNGVAINEAKIITDHGDTSAINPSEQDNDENLIQLDRDYFIVATTNSIPAYDPDGHPTISGGSYGVDWLPYPHQRVTADGGGGGGGGSSGASDVNVTELRIGTIQVAP